MTAQLTKDASYTYTFLLVDADDDETGEPSKSPTVYISKAGGAFETTTNSATEVDSGDAGTTGEGWYKVTLTTSEINTVGDLDIVAVGTGTDVWREKCQVVAAPTGPYTVTISETQYENIADEVLRRSATNADGSSQGDTVNQRSLLAAIRLLLNRTENNTVSGELDVYEEDDTTIAFSIPVTTTTYDNAAVITARNPSG